MCHGNGVGSFTSFQSASMHILRTLFFLPLIILQVFCYYLSVFTCFSSNAKKREELLTFPKYLHTCRP